MNKRIETFCPLWNEKIADLTRTNSWLCAKTKCMFWNANYSLIREIEGKEFKSEAIGYYSLKGKPERLVVGF